MGMYTWGPGNGTVRFPTVECSIQRTTTGQRIECIWWWTLSDDKLLIAAFALALIALGWNLHVLWVQARGKMAVMEAAYYAALECE